MKAITGAVVLLLLGLALASAASERRLFEDLKTGCGLRCSECKTGPSCTSGKPKIHCCWNPFGPKPKDGTCSDARSDKNNCGACGTKCGPAQTCCTGVCKNLNTDDANCGLCSRPCLGDTKCQDGTCVANCPSGQTKCGSECKELSTDPSNCGACGNQCSSIQACQAGNCVDLFTTDLTWVTTNGGNLNGNPWVITQDGTTIRYNVEKSGNCGGANYNTQVGTATATITVGPVAALFSFELSGVGELELPDYDEMTLKFDGQQVGFAHAAGGNKGCVDGPVVFALQTTLPISMAANTVHTFELRFSTNDANFHVNSFYQLDLSFAPQA